MIILCHQDCDEGADGPVEPGQIPVVQHEACDDLGTRDPGRIGSLLPQKYKYDPGPPDQLLVLHPRVWLASYRGLPHRHPELPDGESQVPREGRDALGVRRLQTDPHRLQALPLLTSWNPGEKMTQGSYPAGPQPN